MRRKLRLGLVRLKGCSRDIIKPGKRILNSNSLLTWKHKSGDPMIPVQATVQERPTVPMTILSRARALRAQVNVHATMTGLRASEAPLRAHILRPQR